MFSCSFGVYFDHLNLSTINCVGCFNYRGSNNRNMALNLIFLLKPHIFQHCQIDGSLRLGWMWFIIYFSCYPFWKAKVCGVIVVRRKLKFSLPKSQNFGVKSLLTVSWYRGCSFATVRLFGSTFSRAKSSSEKIVFSIFCHTAADLWCFFLLPSFGFGVHPEVRVFRKWPGEVAAGSFGSVSLVLVWLVENYGLYGIRSDTWAWCFDQCVIRAGAKHHLRLFYVWFGIVWWWLCRFLKYWMNCKNHSRLVAVMNGITHVKNSTDISNLKIVTNYLMIHIPFLKKALKPHGNLSIFFT